MQVICGGVTLKWSTNFRQLKIFRKTTKKKKKNSQLLQHLNLKANELKQSCQVVKINEMLRTLVLSLEFESQGNGKAW